MTFSNDSIRINADSVSRRTSSRHLSTKRAKLILQASVLILCSRPSVRRRLIRKPTDTDVCNFSSSSATGVTRKRYSPHRRNIVHCRSLCHPHSSLWHYTIIIGTLNIIIYYYHSDCRRYNHITALKSNVIIVVISPSHMWKSVQVSNIILLLLLIVVVLLLLSSYRRVSFT